MIGLVIGLLARTSSTLTPRMTHAAYDKFAQMDGTLSTLRWDAITTLDQAVSRLQVSADGVVQPEFPLSNCTDNCWPMAGLVDAAHGNDTLIVVAVHVVSKDAAAELFASPVNTSALQSAAAALAAFALAAGYDGMQLDIEGLQTASKDGYEAFVAACAAALRAAAGPVPVPPRLSVTLYAPKLITPSTAGAYDIARLAELADLVYIMGYDMTWLGAPPGSGALEAGPNSPINGLTVALDNAAAAGAPAAKLVLGLPLYGRLYTCDGAGPPVRCLERRRMVPRGGPMRA